MKSERLGECFVIKREWDLLFSEYDLHQVLQQQLLRINDYVLQISKDRFGRESNDFLAASVASELVVSPLTIHEDKITVSSKDTKVDVSHDFMRGAWDRSEPSYVDGIEVTYHLPFSGDSTLWKCHPSSFTHDPPRALIDPKELRFPYDQADRDVSATKKEFQEDIASIKKWLSWVNSQVKEYNSTLEAAVGMRIAKRHEELGRTVSELAALGYPVVTSETESEITSPTSRQIQNPAARRATSRKKVQRTYDVALSFAGEDREYVEKVAERLKDLNVEVFYDRFEQVDLWGKDLAEHFGEIYSKNSRFVVIFASHAYTTKAWPTLEKRHALSRYLTGDKERILPVRFDDSDIPGIPSTIGYLDLRVLTPEKLAELIRQKVDAESAE